MLWNQREHFHEVVGMLNNQYKPCSRLPHENQALVDEFKEYYKKSYEKKLLKRDMKLTQRRYDDPKRWDRSLLALITRMRTSQPLTLDNKSKKIAHEIQDYLDDWMKLNDWFFTHYPPLHLWLPTPTNLEEKIHWLFENPLRYEQHAQYEWKSNWVHTDYKTKIKFTIGLHENRFMVNIWYMITDGAEKYDAVFRLQYPDQCFLEHYDYTSSSEVITLRNHIRQKVSLLGSVAPVTLLQRIQMKQKQGEIYYTTEWYTDEETTKKERRVTNGGQWTLSPEKYCHYGGKQAESILNYTWKRWRDLVSVYGKLSSPKPKPYIATL